MKFFTRNYTGKKQVAIYFAGTLIGQVTGFIMLPIYTSHLTPADYGVVGLLITMLSIMGLLFGARFSQALPKFFYENKDTSYQKSLISTALISSILVSLLFYFAIRPFSSSISNVLFGTEGYQHLLDIYLVTLITVGVERYGLSYIRIKEWPILFVSASVVKLILQLSLNIYLIVYQGMGALGIIISSVTASSIYAIFYIAIIFADVSIRFSREIFKKLLIYSWPLWIAGLGALYISASSRISIRYFSSLDDLGLYELAAKFASVIPMLIWRPFSQWWQTERFKLYNSHDKGIGTYNMVFNRAAFVMLSSAFAISTGYEPVVRIMADPSYLPSTSATLPLCLALTAECLLPFFIFSFLVREKTNLVTGLRFTAAVILTAALALLVPRFGFAGAAYALFIANTLTLLIANKWSKNHFDCQISLQMAGKLLMLFLGLSLLTEQLTTPLSLSAAISVRLGMLVSGLGIAAYLARSFINFAEIINTVLLKLNKGRSNG